VVRALALPFAVAAVVMWTSPVAAAEPQPNTAVYAIGKCFDLALPPPQRPTRFDYNCDGTGVLQDMTWTTWGVDGANGVLLRSLHRVAHGCAALDQAGNDVGRGNRLRDHRRYARPPLLRTEAELPTALSVHIALVARPTRTSTPHRYFDDAMTS
jgi:hypothetical protein